METPLGRPNAFGDVGRNERTRNELERNGASLPVEDVGAIRSEYWLQEQYESIAECLEVLSERCGRATAGLC